MTTLAPIMSTIGINTTVGTININSTTTQNMYDQEYVDMYKDLTSVVAPTLLGFEVIIGTVFSIIGLVMLISITHENKIYPSLFYINIIIANIILTTLSIPFMTYQYSFGNWIYGRVMCNLFTYTRSLSLFVIAYSLTVLSLFRFMIYGKPKYTGFRKYSTFFLSILSIWVFSGLLNLHTLMSYDVYTFEDGVSLCHYVSNSAGKINVLIHLIVGFLIPLILSVAFQIFTYLQRKNVSVAQIELDTIVNVNTVQTRRNVKDQSKVLFAQTIIFLLTQFPSLVYISVCHMNSYALDLVILLKYSIAVFTISMAFPFVFCIILGLSNEYRNGYYRIMNLAGHTDNNVQYKEIETFI
ncbi:hypothetical protein A3Q56_02067 [Intoshia linei]|uniref:G-protein coupled receptors family 1 profile domain-containing protein n=1 Tax=Intoshia linei TaxID=1819745 RepID=A0A177B7C0_9BILA|nr:hypothetical protein A3Q56_02067 [Intoshia linei]